MISNLYLTDNATSLGPARVSTMRGRYMQPILRVSADGQETCTPANVQVQGDRTLNVYVEHVGMDYSQDGHNDNRPL